MVVIAYGFFVMIYGFKASVSLLWTVVLPGMIVAVLPFVFLAAGVEPWFYFLVCASREKRAKESREEGREGDIHCQYNLTLR